MTTDRPAMLAIVAAWPIPVRLAFGLRANELEDAGTPFPESEHQAFAEVRARLDAGEFRATAGDPTPARRTGRDLPNLFGGGR